MSFLAEFSVVLELLAIVALLGLLVYLQRRHRVLQYVVFLRFPLIHALFLLLLFLAKDTRAFGTLFVLDAPELAAVAFLVVFSSWAAMYTAALIFIGAAPRFGLRFDEPDDAVAKEKKEAWDLHPPANTVPGWLRQGRLY